MSRKKLIQLLSPFLLILGLLLAIPGLDWRDTHSKFAYASLVLGTLGSIISIFIPTNYILFFNPGNWIKNNDNSHSLLLFIKASKHGQGNSPTVQFFITEENGSYELVETAATHDKQGNITIGINNIYDMSLTGKVVIT